MKKKWLALFAAGLMLFGSACSDAKSKQFFGDLEDMKIDYDARSAEIEAKYWWDRGNDSSDRHVALVYDMAWAGIVAEIKSGECSVDKLSLSALPLSDNAADALLRNFLIDYRYRQVILLAKCGDADADAVKSRIGCVRKYAPEAEIVCFSRSEAELDLFEAAASDDENARTEALGSDALEQIERAIEDCPVKSVRGALSEGAQTDEYTSRKREGIEWSNFRFRDANLTDWQAGKKRILFVGDSISWGYGDEMDGKLDFTMDYIRTSRGADDLALIRELDFFFAQYDYDVIHINIGLHDRRLDAEEYRDAMELLFERIRTDEKGAKLLFSNTTDKSKQQNGEWVHDASASAAIEEMNELLYELCKKEQIPYNDLYQFVVTNEFKKIDMLHFQKAAYDRMAQNIAAFIRRNV